MKEKKTRITRAQLLNAWKAAHELVQAQDKLIQGQKEHIDHLKKMIQHYEEQATMADQLFNELAETTSKVARKRDETLKAREPIV